MFLFTILQDCVLRSLFVLVFCCDKNQTVGPDGSVASSGMKHACGVCYVYMENRIKNGMACEIGEKSFEVVILNLSVGTYGIIWIL